MSDSIGVFSSNCPIPLFTFGRADTGLGFKHSKDIIVFVAVTRVVVIHVRFARGF